MLPGAIQDDALAGYVMPAYLKGWKPAPQWAVPEEGEGTGSAPGGYGEAPKPPEYKTLENLGATSNQSRDFRNLSPQTMNRIHQRHDSDPQTCPRKRVWTDSSSQDIDDLQRMTPQQRRAKFFHDDGTPRSRYVGPPPARGRAPVLKGSTRSHLPPGYSPPNYIPQHQGY